VPQDHVVPVEMAARHRDLQLPAEAAAAAMMAVLTPQSLQVQPESVAQAGIFLEGAAMVEPQVYQRRRTVVMVRMAVEAGVAIA
jgi:hypothetical protein